MGVAFLLTRCVLRISPTRWIFPLARGRKNGDSRPSEPRTDGPRAEGVRNPEGSWATRVPPSPSLRATSPPRPKSGRPASTPSATGRSTMSRPIRRSGSRRTSSPAAEPGMSTVARSAGSANAPISRPELPHRHVPVPGQRGAVPPPQREHLVAHLANVNPVHCRF